MFTIRNLVYFLVIVMLLVSGCEKQAAETETASKKSSTAIPEPVPEIDPELQAALKNCENVQPGQACLVEGPVQVTAQPERNPRPFQQPGQTVNLADVQSLKLGEAGSTKGILVMRIQTEWPGGDFRAVAFGNVELVNEVPYGTLEFNPMQSLKLVTSANEEGQKPTSGLFATSPEDGNLSTLVVNGVELSFGSSALLTGGQGGLTIQTIRGMVGAWISGEKAVGVGKGSRLDLEKQENEQIVVTKQGEDDPQLVKDLEDDDLLAPLVEPEKVPEEDGDLLAPLVEPEKVPEEDGDLLAPLQAQEELRKKIKPWKGGWWKMTYGPTTKSGQCREGQVVADGISGDGGEPYSTEIPICRGNNGNTILMYESGTSYERIAPNLYAESYVNDIDLVGNGKITTDGRFTTLTVVSPTRMIFNNAGANAGGCTVAGVAYLDYVRDDPNIRCGYITEISPYDTPEPPTPTPEPQKVDPPIEGEYQVRVGIPLTACDPAAQAYAPNFTSAQLSLAAQDKLVLEAGATRYELEPTKLTYRYRPEGAEELQTRSGIFTLEQLLESPFHLMLSILQMPGGEWTGNWLVANEDGSQICSGSIDLLPPG
jgi:hypothetical protein